MTDIASLIKTVPQLYDDTVAIKLVEVAKKYNTPEVSQAGSISRTVVVDWCAIGRANYASARVHQAWWT